jgi:hypothetical protein
MRGPADIGHRPYRGIAVLLGERAHDQVADLLIILNDRSDRAGGVAGRDLAPLADLVAKPQVHRIEQTLLAAEAADDGLHRHLCIAGDVLQPDLVKPALPQMAGEGLEDACRRRLGGESAGGLAVGATRDSNIHANRYNMKIEERNIDVNLYRTKISADTSTRLSGHLRGGPVPCRHSAAGAAFCCWSSALGQ